MDNKLTKKQLIVAIITFLSISVIALLAIIKPEDIVTTSDTDNGLKQILGQEEGKIRAAIANKYAFLEDKMTIKEVLMIHDSRHAAVIVEVESVKYRASLSQKDNQWQLDGRPDIFLSYDNYPDTPAEIIKTINRLEIK